MSTESSSKKADTEPLDTPDGSLYKCKTCGVVTLEVEFFIRDSYECKNCRLCERCGSEPSPGNYSQQDLEGAYLCSSCICCDGCGMGPDDGVFSRFDPNGDYYQCDSCKSGDDVPWN